MIRRFLYVISILTIIFLVGCQTGLQPSQSLINITIIADGKEITASVPANSTVQSSLVKAGVVVGPLDRVDPPLNTLTIPDSKISVVRVVEEFSEATETIPFEKQVVKNESLAAGESRLLQAGVNGERVVTYKKVYEDNLEISNTEFKSVILKEALPEITMVGVQTPFTAKDISGVLAYIDNGNAWVINASTGSRRPIVTTGDLDGHVFAISYDREWLLYSRKGGTDQGNINSLWVIRLTREDAQPIDLQISNVIHFADFIPNAERTIVFSTVEPREAAPGWQANNDLYYKVFNAAGTLGSRIKKVDSNSGGVYGWWGTSFLWSSDGSKLAYSRPDEIGLVNLGAGTFEPLISITPYETHSDWAWVPGLAWSPDGKFFYTTVHQSSNDGTITETSPLFDLTAIPADATFQIALEPNAGMFNDPVVSPFMPDGTFKVAYLEAIFPDRSDSSRYRLMSMDQDGSNKKMLMPEEGSPGLNPQTVQWAPDLLNGEDIAVLYDGNLWLVDAKSGNKNQVTGDGLITRIAWR